MTPEQLAVLARLDSAERELVAELERGGDWLGRIENAEDWRAIYELGKDAGFRAVPMPELFRTVWRAVMDDLQADPRNVRRISARDIKTVTLWDNYVRLTQKKTTDDWDDDRDGRALRRYAVQLFAAPKKKPGRPPGTRNRSE